MMRLCKALAALLFALALANTGRQVRTIYQSSFTVQDSIARADTVFEPIRKKLENMGLTRLGYRTEPGSVWATKDAEFFAVQYALAPIILRPHTPEDDWVLMNYSATVKPFPAPDLIAVEDFGQGLALYRKPIERPRPGIPQLGKIWHEVEGPWVGTWKRRGNSGTFDATWKDPNGFVLRDEVVFESFTGGEIVLYRIGTKGRYRGRLSDDGTRVENGQGEFEGTLFGWAATIEKQ